MRNVARLFATAILTGWLLGDAPAIAAPTDGASELQLSAGFFHAQGSDSGNLNLDLGYGYYLTPGWQIGIRQGLNYNFIDDSRDFWLASTTPFFNYHFHRNRHHCSILGRVHGFGVERPRRYRHHRTASGRQVLRARPHVFECRLSL